MTETHGPFYDPTSPTGWPPEWTPDLVELLEQERQAWPEGHPCRRCGALYREHPVGDCETWS